MKVDDLKPTRGFVLLLPDSNEEMRGEIFIVKKEKEAPVFGTVLAVGPWVEKFKKNDRVIYKKWGGSEIKIDGVKYLFIVEADILGKIK